MNRSLSPIVVVGFLLLTLAVLPVTGLPYGPFDWIVLSQGYGALENLALNRPAVASSYIAGQPPSHAVDGDLDTAWESYSYVREWFYVILDSPQQVNQVAVHWGDNYASRYRISVLVGGHTGYWQPVYEETAGEGGLDFVSFSSVYGSAVAISMYGRAPGAPNFSIREFEVYYLPPDIQAGDNLAAGRPARATSYLPGYEPTNVTDADVSTSWRPDPRYDRYTASIHVDLGDVYDVSQVDLYWGELRPNHYRLYAWVFVWSGWHGYWGWWPLHDWAIPSEHDATVVEPISTRYVRLVTFGDAGYGADLREFEVYSGTGTPDDDATVSPGYLTPDATQDGLADVLRDMVPPGWEDSPGWQRTPSKDGIPAPELAPLKSLPSRDR